jgi:subtilisin family serine protease
MITGKGVGILIIFLALASFAFLDLSLTGNVISEDLLYNSSNESVASNESLLKNNLSIDIVFNESDVENNDTNKSNNESADENLTDINLYEENTVEEFYNESLNITPEEENPYDETYIIGVNKPNPKRSFGIAKSASDISREQEQVKDRVSEKFDNIVDISASEFASELNETDLKNLKNSPDVAFIEPVREFKIILSQSVPLINATSSWNLKINSLNLTGIGQTVCIIDTGINFNHRDLLVKNLTCNIYCDPSGDSCSENCDETDLNGHGTHVAGIVAASGSITGVAPGANLIGVKVFSGSSGSDASTLSIKRGIDWCTNNAENYNISVISMSLGTSEKYSDFCDSSYPSFNNSINAANLKNISVVISSGNDGSYTQISSPACIPNAIPVGDVYDANVGGVGWGVCTDLTTAADKIVCHSNRNSLVKLFAPGALINSTYYDGDYETLGGTSMAAPHVAGAIALIKQSLNYAGIKKTPIQIEDILYFTGKTIIDSGYSNLNYSRIDVYSALLESDHISPEVSLLTPENNYVKLTSDLNFSCSAYDWQLSNITFVLWNSSGIFYNYTNSSGANINLTLNSLPENSYNWNCLAYDLNGNYAWASENFSLTTGGISTNTISPANNTATNSPSINFNCSASSEVNYGLINISFNLYKVGLIYNETKNISGFYNSSVFVYNLEEGEYLWNCLSYNNNSAYSQSQNYSITYSAPILVDEITNIPSGGGGGGGATKINTTINTTNNKTNVSTNNSEFDNLTDEEKNATFNIHNISGAPTENKQNAFDLKFIYIAIALVIIAIFFYILFKNKNSKIIKK